MKVNNWKERSQVITVLAGLAIAGLQGLRLSKELRKLVASQTWRRSSPGQKQQLLNEQYHRDFLAADRRQREVITATRRNIEAQLKLNKRR